MPQSNGTVVYRTNIGSSKYKIVKTGPEASKRFHVVLTPKNRKTNMIYSGPDFGEACQRLFQDGKARVNPIITQQTIEPQPA